MHLRRIAVLPVVFLLLCSLGVAQVPTPSQFLGFEVGADRKVADYKQIVSYFNELAKRSPRVQVENLGKTTLGNDMVMAVISSEQNLKNKKRYQEIARKLADPRGLTKEQIEALVKEGRTIVLVTCNIHSTEIGASQMAMEWAYTLATTNDLVTRERLDNVILLLVPSLNPDGQIMETEWYRKQLGSKFEGGRMPWLYHHYVGHDNNRDWYMLTQKESQAMSRAVYHTWFPQVWLDEHQMGQTGPRMFVPPYSDPMGRNINPLVFRGVNLIGMNMAWRLEEAKKPGVIYAYSFDAYWPGGTKNTAWFKNIYGLLTEVASARMATPVDVSPTELTGGSKGLVEYGQTTNYPNPWKGGRWTLRDIMDYERIASDALLESCSKYREDLQRGTATMALDAVKAGGDDYYRIPMQQRDRNAAARIAKLMREHNVDVLAGSDAYWIPLAQPYGKFVDELMGAQRYPKVKAVAGPNIIAPYDVAAWSLPMMMGVAAERVTVPAEERKQWRPLTDADLPQGQVTGRGNVFALAHDQNDAFKLVNEVLRGKGKVSVAKQAFTAEGKQFTPGTFVIEGADAEALAKKYTLPLTALAQAPQGTSPMKTVRVGLYKPWLASMDEGWTRFVLEQYGFEMKNVDNKTVRAGNLNTAFDVIVIPDVEKEVIIDGKPPRRDEGAMRYWAEFPSEYAGGIGREGVTALKTFVEQGGTVVTLASGGELIADEFNVPVRNALARVRSDEFSCPGSLLRVNLDTTHPLNWGMAETAAAFVGEAIAYQTAVPGAELDRAVVAWYPEDEEDILLSGWMRGADKLTRRAAAVTFNVGKGKIVMFGFRPQFRAQTEGTYKMLFNALHWAGM